MARLQQPYRPFQVVAPAAAPPPHLTIQLCPNYPFRPAGSRADPVTFCHGTARIATPTCEGTIDLERGQARLALAEAPATCATRTASDVEYMLRVACALLAFRAGGVLFHGAGIVRHGRAYLFFGHSGSGKTTAARLSPDDLVLNDDLVVVMPHNGAWMVHATPFTNPTQVGATGPAAAPLGAMLRLVKSQRVAIEPVGAGRMLAEVLASIPVLPSNPEYPGRLLEWGQQLLQQVPAYRLHFLRDASFWQVVEPLGAREA
ncbi:MAG: hypothetical protein HC884_04845 [Chloroflexaceae bacterium]|nr:hypothetical protein [Chloroflexaceae bacterium]